MFEFCGARPSSDVFSPRPPPRPGDDRNAWEPASIPSSCQVSASASRTEMQMQRAKPPIQLSASGTRLGSGCHPDPSSLKALHDRHRARPESRAPMHAHRVAGAARPGTGGTAVVCRRGCVPFGRILFPAMPTHACRPTTPPPTRPRTGCIWVSKRRQAQAPRPVRDGARAFPRFRRLALRTGLPGDKGSQPVPQRLACT